MYAVIVTGGKQYRVSEGDCCKFEQLDYNLGDTVEFENVLLLADNDQITLGKPYVSGAKVTGEIINQGRHDKIHVIHFRRRKHHIKRQGHRQNYTQVKITAIEGAQSARSAQSAQSATTAKSMQEEEVNHGS